MHKFSRRDFLKITAVAGGGLIGASLFSKKIWQSSYVVTDTRELMGTIIHLKIVCRDEEEGREVIRNTYLEMERVIKMFNLRDPDSQISRLNQAGRLNSAAPELIDVVSVAIRYGDLSGGAFDVTILPVLEHARTGRAVPERVSRLVDYRNIQVDGKEIVFKTPGMQITLDGIAKGFVVDQAVEALKKQGYDQVLVEAGGDLAVNGRESHDQGWSIGVSSPRPQKLEGYLAVFSISKGAVATSGDYLNWFSEDMSSHHIINPVSLLSPQELASVTVFAPTAMEADALSTTIMVLGADEGLRLANQLESIEAMVVTKDLSIKRTLGFPTTIKG